MSVYPRSARVLACSFSNSLSYYPTLRRFTTAAPTLSPLPAYNGPPPLDTSRNDGLHALMRAVEEYQSTGHTRALYLASGNYLVLYDQFPKSRYHLLVLPSNTQFDTLTSIACGFEKPCKYAPRNVATRSTSETRVKVTVSEI